ncbi:cell division protein FtsK [Streptococcus sp. SPS1]|uniref:cell division protein FtsK n=1 Tax=Streptococcus sp. SPS1 TaxID=3018247 RepID=UPI00345E6D58
MLRRKRRRIKATKNSKMQSYQVSLIAFANTVVLTGAINFVRYTIPTISTFITVPFFIALVLDCILVILFIVTWIQREEVSTITIPNMSSNARQLSKKLKKLFNDKQITDVLKLSNSTRYGDEMPEISVWVNETLIDGYIAIENIANWERADREKFEQRVSGILAGKYQRFAVITSELTAGDSFIIFYFEDTLTSQRLIVKDNTDSLKPFVNDDKHAIKLSKNLIWHSDIVPRISIIARTRAGKSVLAGRYLARLMLLQGWTVEYNSAKYDRYVKEFNGQSEPIEIVKRAEYWCTVMDDRLAKINKAGKDKYLEMEDMPDIALFFDELGNLMLHLNHWIKLIKP